MVRSARDFSVDFVFPTLTRIFEKKTVFGDKLKHVIEPRAVYRYVTGIGTDFNRFIRFDERDLLANTNELMLSVTNRDLRQARRQRAGDLHLGAHAEALLRSDVRRRPADRERATYSRPPRT